MLLKWLQKNYPLFAQNFTCLRLIFFCKFGLCKKLQVERVSIESIDWSSELKWVKNDIKDQTNKKLKYEWEICSVTTAYIESQTLLYKNVKLNFIISNLKSTFRKKPRGVEQRTKFSKRGKFRKEEREWWWSVWWTVDSSSERINYIQLSF